MTHDLHPRQLTWAALLGQWMQFAQSALALPDDAMGRAGRAAVADIIGLQAVTMALHEAHELPVDERSLGLDRARILVASHTDSLQRIFAAGPLPPLILELIDDAHAAIAQVESI
jgi:hypothetical protein